MIKCSTVKYYVSVPGARVREEEKEQTGKLPRARLAARALSCAFAVLQRLPAMRARREAH